MPGRTPREAVGAFIDPLKDSLSCIARAKITLSHDGWGSVGTINGLTLNNDQPVQLTCQPRLLLRISMLYEIIRTDDPARGPWRVSTRAYAYELQTSDRELVWSYHWHPQSRVGNPHAHIGHTQLAEHSVLSHKAHYPTGRVSLESVIRTCITEYGVQPLDPEWDKTLALREGDFEIYRSWS